MASEQFRRQLRREAEQWRVDGLIQPSQYDRLSTQYQFEALEAGARDRFILVLLGLGSILLGLGVITFVAANWQAISRVGKLALLLSLFLVANATGFYLLKRPLDASGRERWTHRLGHGLLLLGALVLGANLALSGQLFHRSGAAYELCLVWGLGVLLMAFGLRLPSLGLLAILLMGIGYWWGLQEISRTGTLMGLSLLMRYMPLVVGGLFTLLAYWCRSRIIFGAGAIALVSSLEVAIADAGHQVSDIPGVTVAIAFTLPAALLWSYDDALWWRLLNRPLPLARSFRPVAQALALVWLTGLTYLMSFHNFWRLPSDQPVFGKQLSTLFTDGAPLLLNPNLFVLTALTLLSWFYLAYPRHRGSYWGLAQRDVVMLLLIAAVGLVALWNWGIYPILAIGTYLYNVLLFLLAASFIRQGLAKGNRILFWCGMSTLILQILSRILEYDTGLLLKSVVFLLCGVGVMLVGLWFERYVRTLTPSTLTPAPQEETV